MAGVEEVEAGALEVVEAGVVTSDEEDSTEELAALDDEATLVTGVEVAEVSVGVATGVVSVEGTAVLVAVGVSYVIGMLTLGVLGVPEGVT